MPIYEYSCRACRGRFSKLVQSFREPDNLACPRCGNQQVQRAISRFAVVRSEEARLDTLADPTLLSGLDENDPHSVARWAKKMGKELGEDLGEDWDEMVDQMIEEEMSGEQSGERAGHEDDLGWG